MNKKLVSQKIELIANEILIKIHEHKKEKQLGVLNGDFGILLFLFYYARYSKKQSISTLVEKYAKELLTILPRRINSFTFCSGLSGILCLFEFLRNRQFIDIDISAYKAEFELYITNEMKKDFSIGNYDFMHGAIGGGTYFLNQHSNIQPINDTIDFLYNTAEKEDTYTLFKWQSVIDSRTQTKGYNIALSHGISSIIIFLSNVIKSGIENEKIRLMLKGSINYVLSQQVNAIKYGCYFPSHSLEQSNSLKSRLAWCYGDLGIAMSLWQASRLLTDSELQKFTLEVLIQSTHRISYPENIVNDAGICHGSAGIAMIYNRMYIDTKMSLFKDARNFWLARTLNYSCHNDGLAGYKTVYGKELIKDYSLLTGISGVGLVFISYLMNDEQDWDKFFLLS
ncbi:lanthionine synthetase C family protein [uncultured Bacteroides sp.]|jgi:hypothetical protein|uniref:lanthionine synthetase C family protein n=1 Tax=uncultured Bacteroides sp. TaxID=162156 RepID=UPI002582DD30|nr:lanthionine synthetase C family protein [uncultured Bacteroides sp.]